jgi:hypothetical protein
MARPTMRQQLVKAARETGTFTPAQLPPKVACPRCGTEVYASADGTPRGHLRATRPGEELYRSEIPTMTDCTE